MEIVTVELCGGDISAYVRIVNLYGTSWCTEELPLECALDAIRWALADNPRAVRLPDAADPL